MPGMKKGHDFARCSVPGHRHHPSDCKGRGRIKCKMCGKAVARHKTLDHCTDGSKT